MNKIIGISGKLGSGKDTVAEYLRDKYGFQICSFALNVRKICSILTGIPVEVLLTREAKGMKVNYKNKVVIVGELLQIVGEGLRNSIHPDVWVNSLFNNLQSQIKIAIPDVRYPNELIYIQKQGGIVIRIEGDPANIRRDIESGKSADKRDLKAPSEIALDEFTFAYIIYNNKSKEELYKQIDLIVKGFNI